MDKSELLTCHMDMPRLAVADVVFGAQRENLSEMATILPSDADLYYSDKEEYVQGIVSETVPHITLLWGLHPDINREEAADKVNFVTDESVYITKVSHFEGPDWITIVALIHKTNALETAHRILKGYPHTPSEHKTWTPHMTLAYVRKSAPWRTWVSILDKRYSDTVLTPRYGVFIG